MNGDGAVVTTMTRGGTYMKEKPQSVAPKSSETDPPAANQPVGVGVDDTPDASAEAPATRSTTPETPQVVPGKPDGEVDTRA
jgi:hypothetical protein